MDRRLLDIIEEERMRIKRELWKGVAIISLAAAALCFLYFVWRVAIG